MPQNLTLASGVTDPRPEWIRPENDSVFDSGLEQAVKWLVRTLGMDDPNDAIQAQMNPLAGPMIGLVPKQSMTELAGRFIPTQVALGAPESAQQAIMHLIKRFPRLMSHVQGILPIPLSPIDEAGALTSVTKGRMFPAGIANDPQWVPARMGKPAYVDQGRIADIQYDPRVVINDADAVNTLSHELTHAAQALRQTDRARRNVAEPSFPDKYTANREKYGYHNQPEEVSARRSSGKETSRYVSGLRREPLSPSGTRVEQMAMHIQRMKAVGRAPKLSERWPDVTPEEVNQAFEMAAKR